MHYLSNGKLLQMYVKYAIVGVGSKVRRKERKVGAIEEAGQGAQSGPVARSIRLGEETLQTECIGQRRDGGAQDWGPKHGQAPRPVNNGDQNFSRQHSPTGLELGPGHP